MLPISLSTSSSESASEYASSAFESSEQGLFASLFSQLSDVSGQKSELASWLKSKNSESLALSDLHEELPLSLLFSWIQEQQQGNSLPHPLGSSPVDDATLANARTVFALLQEFSLQQSSELQQDDSLTRENDLLNNALSHELLLTKNEQQNALESFQSLLKSIPLNQSESIQAEKVQLTDHQGLTVKERLQLAQHSPDKSLATLQQNQAVASEGEEKVLPIHSSSVRAIRDLLPQTRSLAGVPLEQVTLDESFHGEEADRPSLLELQNNLTEKSHLNASTELKLTVAEKNASQTLSSQQIMAPPVAEHQFSQRSVLQTKLASQTTTVTSNDSQIHSLGGQRLSLNITPSEQSTLAKPAVLAKENAPNLIQELTSALKEPFANKELRLLQRQLSASSVPTATVTIESTLLAKETVVANTMRESLVGSIQSVNEEVAMDSADEWSDFLDEVTDLNATPPALKKAEKTLFTSTFQDAKRLELTRLNGWPEVNNSQPVSDQADVQLSDESLLMSMTAQASEQLVSSHVKPRAVERTSTDNKLSSMASALAGAPQHTEDDVNIAAEEEFGVSHDSVELEFKNKDLLAKNKEPLVSERNAQFTPSRVLAEMGFGLDSVNSDGAITPSSPSQTSHQVHNTPHAVSQTVSFQQQLALVQEKMELLHEKLAPLLGQRLMMMVEQKIQQAEIQLDPPELGSLMVRIQVNQDQAHVSFVAQHAHAKDALEQALPKLKEMFQQQNMDLVQADVSQQKQQGGQQGESAQAQGQQSSQQKSTESQMEPQSRSQPQQNVLQTGKVDYYA